MVTYAQAQELADEWINGGVPRSQQREVRVREFDLGFVCWAVTPAGPADGSGGAGAAGGGSGEARLVIARDSGASTLWPALPVNEVVRQYEEVYGRPVAANPAGAAKPAPGPVEATSFLLSPPQWLQEAGAAAIAAEAERLGTAPAGPQGAAAEAPAPAAATAAAAPVEEPPAPAPRPAPAVLTEPPVSDRPAGDAPTMLAPPPGPEEPPVAPQAAPAAAPAAAPEPQPSQPSAEDGAATVLMPEGLRITGSDLPEPAAPAGAEAATMLMPPTGGGYGVPPVPPTAAPQAPVPAPAAAPAPAAPPAPPVPAPAAEPAPTLLAPPDAVPGLMGLPGAPAQATNSRSGLAVLAWVA
ncbi:hypothetical protein ABZW03_39890, partial [Kitasatospora sp. NPDC004799]